MKGEVSKGNKEGIVKIGLIILSFLVGALIIPPAFAVDFEGATEFTNITLEGSFRVTCQNGREFRQANHYCRGYILNPTGSFARLTDDSGVVADRVELQTTRKDGGRVIKKRMRWDAANGQTERDVNLWVRTLFQRPLLEMGDNEVRYAYTKNGQRVKEGSFFANVAQGEARSCEPRTLHTGNLFFCENYGSACNHYFTQQNNCE